MSTWYADVDHDGFGDPLNTVDRCVQPGGYVASAGDCDDTDTEVWAIPGEATDLLLSDDGVTTTLSWTAPSNPGGTAPATSHRAVYQG